MLMSLRYWAYLVAALVCVAVGASVTYLIDRHHYDGLQAQFEDYQLRAAEAQAQIARDAQARLSAQADKIQEIERQSQEKATADEKRLADLHARYDGLRILTRCPAHPSMPAATDPSINTRPGTAEVVPRTIGRDLVGLAADAERVRTQLIACQAVVRSIQ